MKNITTTCYLYNIYVSCILNYFSDRREGTFSNPVYNGEFSGQNNFGDGDNVQLKDIGTINGGNITGK